MNPRRQWETEQNARARAERDDKTRQRITYAAEILAAVHGAQPGGAGLTPAVVRALHRRGKLGAKHAMLAGLTRGEAAAAGFR